MLMSENPILDLTPAWIEFPMQSIIKHEFDKELKTLKLGLDKDYEPIKSEGDDLCNVMLMSDKSIIDLLLSRREQID